MLIELLKAEVTALLASGAVVLQPPGQSPPAAAVPRVADQGKRGNQSQDHTTAASGASAAASAVADAMGSAGVAMGASVADAVVTSVRWAWVHGKSTAAATASAALR